VFALDTTGLMTYWSFDENTGDTAQDSAGGYDGTLINSPSWIPGTFGSALNFDGTNQYVSLPDNEPIWLPIYDFTISVWVKHGTPVGTPDGTMLDLNHANSSTSSNELGCAMGRHDDTGVAVFAMTTTTNPDDDLYGTMPLLMDSWYHMVVVREGTFLGIYINGQLDNSKTCSPDPIDFVGGYDDDSVHIGARKTSQSSNPINYFNGTVDELMIFERALNPTEVTELYNVPEPVTLMLLSLGGLVFRKRK